MISDNEELICRVKESYPNNKEDEEYFTRLNLFVKFLV